MRIACSELPVWLNGTATIVTPSPFLAGVAQEQLNRERLKRGLETWERPAIFGLDAWLEACWSEARYAIGGHSISFVGWRRSMRYGTTLLNKNIRNCSMYPRLCGWHGGGRGCWRIGIFRRKGNSGTSMRMHNSFSTGIDCCIGNAARMDGSSGPILGRQLPAWIADGRFRPDLAVFVGFDEFSSALESIQSALGSLVGAVG